NNKNNYNLVCETLQFLDCICGSTTGGLGLLGLYINEKKRGPHQPRRESLTETASRRTNATALTSSSPSSSTTSTPWGRSAWTLVLELKNNASKLLLAIMESRHDSENAERILYNMRPKELLARHNKELQAMLKPGGTYGEGDEALEFYAKHTAQIEFLTLESKLRVYYTTERDEQGSKINDFFLRSEDLFNEMNWQKKLRAQPILYWCSRNMSFWSSISFNLAVLMNLLVAFFYPLEGIRR
ncbi:hypothetical protein CRUP_026523, partial [Coryphaenoides rupestris]